jgi:hypothetical protein
LSAQVGIQPALAAQLPNVIDFVVPGAFEILGTQPNFKKRHEVESSPLCFPARLKIGESLFDKSKVHKVGSYIEPGTGDMFHGGSWNNVLYDLHEIANPTILSRAAKVEDAIVINIPGSFESNYQIRKMSSKCTSGGHSEPSMSRIRPVVNAHATMLFRPRSNSRRRETP